MFDNISENEKQKKRFIQMTVEGEILEKEKNQLLQDLKMSLEEVNEFLSDLTPEEMEYVEKVRKEIEDKLKIFSDELPTSQSFLMRLRGLNIPPDAIFCK